MKSGWASWGRSPPRWICFQYCARTMPRKASLTALAMAGSTLQTCTTSAMPSAWSARGLGGMCFSRGSRRDAGSASNFRRARWNSWASSRAATSTESGTIMPTMLAMEPRCPTPSAGPPPRMLATEPRCVRRRRALGWGWRWCLTSSSTPAMWRRTGEGVVVSASISTRRRWRRSISCSLAMGVFVMPSLRTSAGHVVALIVSVSRATPPTKKRTRSPR
mmetsp:Transcript_41503/g.90489  ORF Transcript_41503/g.90489 Transcript_41503/m.90489 type:complete len:219 (+) Transcript_41503:1226-1882(+)